MFGKSFSVYEKTRFFHQAKNSSHSGNFFTVVAQIDRKNQSLYTTCKQIKILQTDNIGKYLNLKSFKSTNDDATAIERKKLGTVNIQFF